MEKAASINNVEYGAVETNGDDEERLAHFFQKLPTDDEEQGSPTNQKLLKLLPIGIAIAVVCFLFISEKSGFTNILLHDALSAYQFLKSREIVFTFNRKGYDVLPFYGSDRNSTIKYSFLENYVGLIEPYAANQLNILDEDTSVHSYKYSVCTSSGTCSSGLYYPISADLSTTVSLSCDPFEELSVTVIATDSTGDVLSTAKGSAVCMYVRREIQQLTEDDLQATMDTMYTLWSTSETEGQAVYGDNYHSAAYFTAAHDFNAAQPDADHIHEGIGFIPQHVKMSNMFETSLQAVNPAVTLPYWDFTIEEANGVSVYDSYVFSADVFGSINKPNDTLWGYSYRSDAMLTAAIPDGRWAYSKAGKNTRFPDLANGFGYMRGPWNMNPSPYISRFTIAAPSLPSCSAYYDGLVMTDIMDFLAYAPFDPHAPIHGSVGGFWGCDKLDPLRDAGLIDAKISQRTICAEWGFTIKDLYRSGYLTSRTDCTVSELTEDGVDCGFVCKTDAYENIANKLSVLIQGVRGSMDLTKEQWGQWRDFVCTGDGYKVFVGDHLESASTSDPSFWPMHPTLERLVQLKYIAGTMTQFDWPTETKDICDRFSCYEDGVKDKHTACCNGHYENDGLLDFTTGDVTSMIGPTNRQVLLDTDPTSTAYAMPYIYDNFKMDHCEQDFEGVVKTLQKKR